MPDISVNLVPYPVNVTDKRHGKLIVQIARTNCAGAIWRIHDAINRYTEHTCRTITASDVTSGRKFPHDIFLAQAHEVKAILAKADVVHFHNWIDHEAPEMTPYRHLIAGKIKVLQYHTEPALLQKQYRRDVISRDDITTLAIAQKHARFYPKSLLVPNMVDIYDERLMPVQRPRGVVRVIYTPSDLKSYSSYTNTCCGKGYQQVMPVLKKLQAEGLISFEVITDKTWEELMPIKQQFDVCIDECVTGGYHLCSLEGLSQGLATIAWLDDQTQQAIHAIVGSVTKLPWINTKQDDLELTLRDLAGDREKLEAIQQESRRWMEMNWSPVQLVRHFTDAYWPVKEQQRQAAVGAIDRRWGFSNRLQSVYKVPGVLRQDCRDLAGAWAGRTCVIWGNGPTVTDALALQGQEWFRKAKHIGTNAAMKLGIPFDVYCVGDRRFLEVPEKRQIALTACGVKIYQSVLRSLLPEAGTSFVQTIGRDGFCSDLAKGTYHGYSVVYFALQVAVYTGATDILLAGCGHNYSSEQPRFYKEAKPSEVDDTLPRILNNYRQAIPILRQRGIRVRTIGPSRLEEAGVENFLT